MKKIFSTLFERVNAPVEERDRRWANMRRKLTNHGLDAIIVVSDGHLERRGSMRYVADVGAPGMYGYVIFPRGGDPIAVNVRSINVRGGWIKDTRMVPVRGGWYPESEPYAPIIVDALKDLNLENGNVAIEGDFLPQPVYQKITKELPHCNFSFANIIHELKSVKGEEELKYIQDGVELVDRAFEICLEFATVGKTWNEISSEICRFFYQGRMEDIGGFPLPRSNSAIEPGDQYLYYPEIQAAGGYWIQFGRLVSFGEPDKELRKVWELSIAAQQSGMEKLRPGNRGADVIKAINESLIGTGYTGDTRGSGHGIGLDVLEKPFISLDDENEIKPGMVMALHPIFSPDPPSPVLVADTCLITEKGPQKLSRITPEIRML